MNERDLDTAMHRALASLLPADEPPVGIRVRDVMRRGRRRLLARRAIPIAVAASVVALLIAVPLSTGGDPEQDQLPIGGTSPTRQPVPSTSTAEPREEFHAPAGHRRDRDADALTDTVVRRMPPEHVAADFGTRSDRIASGNRYGFGLHLLWQEGGRYGYLVMLHRTKGDFPASVYGMPDEPCMTPSTMRREYRCTPVTVPEGDVAYAYEIDNGYRVRGIVWDMKDPAGGATIRITGAFFIPEPGAWTPFRALDDGPLLTSVPLGFEELGEVIGIPR